MRRRRFYCEDVGLLILTKKPGQLCQYLKKIGRFTSKDSLTKIGRTEGERENPREDQDIIYPLIKETRWVSDHPISS